jgi:hypothetical protein
MMQCEFALDGGIHGDKVGEVKEAGARKQGLVVNNWRSRLGQPIDLIKLPNEMAFAIGLSGRYHCPAHIFGGNGTIAP